VFSWTKKLKITGARLPVLAGLNGWKGRTVRFIRVLGPYAAIELLLPGGSLIALSVWLYQTSRKKALLGPSAWKGSSWLRHLWPKVSPAGNCA
jgi:hypothetical protein